jgi:hypothetical protein
MIIYEKVTDKGDYLSYQNGITPIKRTEKSQTGEKMTITKEQLRKK